MPASSGELRVKPSSNGIAARLLEGANIDAGTKELLAPAAITPRIRRRDKLCIDLDATMLVPCGWVVAEWLHCGQNVIVHVRLATLSKWKPGSGDEGVH